MWVSWQAAAYTPCVCFHGVNWVLFVFSIFLRVCVCVRESVSVCEWLSEIQRYVSPGGVVRQQVQCGSFLINWNPASLLLPVSGPIKANRGLMTHPPPHSPHPLLFLPPHPVVNVPLKKEVHLNLPGVIYRVEAQVNWLGSTTTTKKYIFRSLKPSDAGKMGCWGRCSTPYWRGPVAVKQHSLLKFKNLNFLRCNSSNKAINRVKPCRHMLCVSIVFIEVPC